VPSVTGFQPMLLDALSTLLLNAIIVSPDGAKLRMALSSPGPTEVAVEVSDAGEMVPEIERPHVFEPFYFSRNPKTKSPGPETATGLNPGLATVKRYIALHGGTVELKDTGPGGSTFLVRLPAAGTAALSSGTAHSAMPSTPSGTGPAVVIPPAG
jgi:signal transduction histidine kinase